MLIFRRGPAGGSDARCAGARNSRVRDVNGGGVVDVFDYLAIAQALYDGTLPADAAVMDLDGDGSVTFADAQIVLDLGGV